MGHLILDRLRRWRLLLYLLVLALPYLPPVFMPLVTALVTALMIGTWFFSRGTSREILQLPLSRKQLWRTRWILAFAVPLLHLFGRVARLGIAVAGGWEAAFSLSWALLIFLFQLSTLGILAVMSGPIRQRASKLLRPAKRLHDFFFFGVCPYFFGVYPVGYVYVALAAMGASILLETPANRQMAEWPAGVPLLLAVGLCTAAISFFHSPQIAPRSVLNLSARKSQGAKTRPLTKSWPTGPALFVWTQIRRAVRRAMISGAAFIVLFTLFRERPPMDFILLFAISFGHSNDTLGLRHLRVLPLSSRTLAAILTLLSVLFCLCSWVVPVAAYRLIMSGRLPWALRLELLSVLAGLSCLVDSAALSAVGTPARMAAGWAAAFIALQLYGTPLPPGAAGLIGLLGLAAIAASSVLNARALRRSSSIYKPLRLSSLSQPRWISE